MKRIPVRRNSQGVARVDDHELGTLAAICSELRFGARFRAAFRPTPRRLRSSVHEIRALRFRRKGRKDIVTPSTVKSLLS
jgi:hypothetical protein